MLKIELVFFALIAATGCSEEVEDLDMHAEDFECIRSWDHVRRFFVTNKLGHVAETLTVANAGQGIYPVGTVIQLVPFEAMVKRRHGFSPASRDWEFFALTDNDDRTTTIVERGGTSDVKNQFNGLPCLDCHAGAMLRFDLVCERDHGCASLGIPDDTIVAAQNADKRCMAGAEP